MIFDTEEDGQITALRTRVATVQRKAMIVTLAIAMSIAGYAVAGVVLVDESKLPSGPDSVRMTIIVVAFFLALASIALRRTQLSASRIEAVAAQRQTEGLIHHFFVVTLILAALAEGIGILAIVVGVLGGTRLDVILFGLVAAIILFSNFPRRAAWERAVEFFASGTRSPIG